MHQFKTMISGEWPYEEFKIDTECWLKRKWGLDPCRVIELDHQTGRARIMLYGKEKQHLLWTKIKNLTTSYDPDWLPAPKPDSKESE